MPKIKVKLNANVRFSQKNHKAGEIVEFDTDDREQLKVVNALGAAGRIEPVAEDAKKSSASGK